MTDKNGLNFSLATLSCKGLKLRFSDKTFISMEEEALVKSILYTEAEALEAVKVFRKAPSVSLR